MKQIEVQILQQSYLLSCPEGHESRLLDAVERVDTAMTRIRDAGKVRARERIAVLAALNLAFEIADREAADLAAGATPTTAACKLQQPPAQRWARCWTRTRSAPGATFAKVQRLWLDNGGGLPSRVCRLSAIGVAEGDVLRAGDPIGAVGATGRAIRPHLHGGVMLDRSMVGAVRFTRSEPTSDRSAQAVRDRLLWPF